VFKKIFRIVKTIKMSKENTLIPVSAFELLHKVVEKEYVPRNRGIGEAESFLLYHGLCDINYRKNGWGLVPTDEGKGFEKEMRSIYGK